MKDPSASLEVSPAVVDFLHWNRLYKFLTILRWCRSHTLSENSFSTENRTSDASCSTSSTQYALNRVITIIIIKIITFYVKYLSKKSIFNPVKMADFYVMYTITLVFKWCFKMYWKFRNPKMLELALHFLQLIQQIMNLTRWLWGIREFYIHETKWHYSWVISVCTMPAILAYTWRFRLVIVKSITSWYGQISQEWERTVNFQTHDSISRSIFMRPFLLQISLLFQQ